MYFSSSVYAPKRVQPLSTTGVGTRVPIEEQTGCC